jgi:hypothetical protein
MLHECVKTAEYPKVHSYFSTGFEISAINDFHLGPEPDFLVVRAHYKWGSFPLHNNRFHLNWSSFRDKFAKFPRNTACILVASLNIQYLGLSVEKLLATHGLSICYS